MLLARLRRASVMLPCLCGAVLVALLVFGVLRQAPDRSLDAGIAAGRPLPAPPYRLSLLVPGAPGPVLARAIARATAAGRLDNRRLRGTPYLVNFWASWCTECALESRALQRAWERGRRGGLLVLGIDVQDAEDQARAFLRERRLDFPSVRDGGGDLLRPYGVTALPETFAVDAHGRVVDHIVGVATPARLRRAMAAVRA
jgi:cytochrome c biogenesis protein CcmG, thiol:disulfide interchange protein DsbE